MTEEEFENWSFKVTWAIDDGYVNNGTHTTKVKPYNDMNLSDWEELDDKEKNLYIEECVQQDFDNVVRFYINYYEI
jgi:hypothetical protein